MEIDLSKGVHELGWVKLRGFFNPTQPWWVKKNPTQPYPSQGSNPTHMDWVGSGWTYCQCLASTS